MTHPQTRTLLRALLEAPELDCVTWPSFRVYWVSVAQQAAEALHEPRLAGVMIHTDTFKRWLAGTAVARGDARSILEFWFGKSVEQLRQPVPEREIVRGRDLNRRTYTAARALDYDWPTSQLVLGEPAAGIGGTWELTGGRLFDGTSIGVQVYEATPSEDAVAIGADDLSHLQTVVRSSRLGLVLTSLGAAGGSGLYVIDAAHSRLQLQHGDEQQRVPRAYQLDDLTYALIWSLHVLDDGLLADDSTLTERADELRHYVQLSASAPARSLMPGLSPAGAAWLGSSLCAQYIVRHLDGPPEAPAFWTREHTGEECAPWLYFRHKHDYLQTVSRRFSDVGKTVGRAFCVPEATVRSSERYERILLFLTVAMMEMNDIKIWLCAEPEYEQIEGFALSPGRAILASWVREDAVWRVGTTTARRDIASYREAIEHARTHNLVDGPTPAIRLRALAEYLDLDWTWLLVRCRALAEEGTANMLRPRSRLLTLQALDQTLHFIGTLGSRLDGH
ncbi:transcriptional regulator, XRE family protein (plasmid) [Streptomyces sp. NBC_01527]|uniref:transcriptional regulator, XRE family protein n=1 Tax=Streptomyces sp. NBC_01527 TaxID=2903894 RepID=UPI002F913375